MAEYHFPIPGSKDETQIILFVRRHWVSFLGQFLVSLAVLIIPVLILIGLYYSGFDFNRGYIPHFFVLGLSIYYLIAFTVAFVSFISFYYDIYIVTSDFIIDIVQEGYWGRKISQISLLRVQDVSSNIQGFFPTFFGYGDVLVETAGEQTQNFLLKSVPNPQEVTTKIMQLHNELIETEGRHHQILEAEGSLAPGTIRAGEHDAGEGHSMSESYSKQVTSSIQKPSTESLPEEKKEMPEPTQETGDIIKATEDNKEGEISQNDLDKGGEIDLNKK